MIIYILLFILLVIYVFSFKIVEYLDDNKVPDSNIPEVPDKLPIKPDYSSDKPLGQYNNELILNPQRLEKERNSVKGVFTEEEVKYNAPNVNQGGGFFNEPVREYTRQDILENKSYSDQPEDLYFDIFDINCTQPYNRPWACLLMKGNYINNLPQENCKRVCPDKFASEEESIPKIEQFKDFISENPQPSHYYCWSYCKKGCTKHEYNPLEPSKNTCGQNGFSSMPLNVYLSEEKCLAESMPCNELTKDQCLNNGKCGWCTDNSGKGYCFEGTTEGPLDVTIPCVPDRMKPTNSFFKGHLDPFDGIKQSW